MRRSAGLLPRPDRRAPALRWLLVVLCAAVLPAAESARIIRGPWWWHGADGAPAVALAVAGAPALPATARLDGRELPVTAELRPLAVRADAADGVVVVRLAAPAAGRLQLALAGQQVSVRLALRPAPDAPARLALAGARAWPDRAGLDALAGALGGPPHLVLALGADVPARLGTGGWEDEVPLAVVAPEDAALAACTGGADAAWRHGLRLGVLGLPASPDRARADLALARDLSPWLTYLDVPGGWDPAIGPARRGDPRDLGVLLAACERLKVPLALGAGAAGLVSEPLVLDAGGAQRVAPEGVRYVLAVPAADDGLAQLAPEIALPLEAPLRAGLTADAASLALVLLGPDATEAVRLSWTRGEAPAPATPGELMRQILAAEALAAPAEREAIARLAWLSRAQLAAIMPPPETVLRLREEGGAMGRVLARRLALIAGDDPAYPALPGDPDPVLVRDRILWRIATVRGADAASWRDEAAACTDPVALRALLADVTRDETRLLLPVLVQRVRLQAEGALPLDADPLDQHRLFAAVFDEVRLSPTPLRPWALALRERADPLARGPLERFLARHGEVRAP